MRLGVFLPADRNILANDQLYALFQCIYLFHLSTCFEQHSAHHQEIDCINTYQMMY